MFLEAQSQQNTTSASLTRPMEVFKSFIGNWVPPDTSYIFKSDPSAKGVIFFSFIEKGNFGLMEVVEHYKVSDKSDASFIGVVCYSPLTGRYDYLGTNPKMNFHFSGTFDNINSKEFTRNYDVAYPKDFPMAQNAGQILSYKERFVLIDENTMEFDILFFSKKDQVWKPWNAQKFRLVRKV